MSSTFNVAPILNGRLWLNFDKVYQIVKFGQFACTFPVGIYINLSEHSSNMEDELQLKNMSIVACLHQLLSLQFALRRPFQCKFLCFLSFKELEYRCNLKRNHLRDMCFQEEPGRKQTKFSSAKNSTRYIFGIVSQFFQILLLRNH